MMEIEQVSAIYRDLPANAQREALDFMMFLKQRYGVGQASAPNVGAAAILESVGFIGSLDAEPDYSEKYKEELTEALESKHDNR